MAEEAVTIPTIDIDVLTQKREAPRLEAILFADYAVIGNDKKTTVAGIFDRVFVDAETRVSGRFFVFIKTAETIDEPIDIKFYDPKGNLVAGGTASADPGQEGIRNLAIIAPFGFGMGPEGTEGPHWFEISYKGQSLGGAVLVVEFRKKEE